MKITVIMPVTRMKRIKVRRDKKSGMTYETLEGENNVQRNETN